MYINGNDLGSNCIERAKSIKLRKCVNANDRSRYIGHTGLIEIWINKNL